MSRNDRIRLVVFDWAGTTVDFGSRAPAAAFANVFAEHGVKVSDEEARRPMGLNKREHLLTMLRMPEITDRWQSVHGGEWSEADVDTMYDRFVPLQIRAIEEHAELVPHLLDVINQLRDSDIRVGGTTGYFRAAAQAVAKRAAEAGFEPDENVCADDVSQGRPAPWMIYRIMERLGVYPSSSVVKVGDTVADIEAGLNAGCWSIGVCDSSSLTGLSAEQYGALSADQRQQHLDRTEQSFRYAGCHDAVHSIADLPGLIEQLSGRLRDGQRP